MPSRDERMRRRAIVRRQREEETAREIAERAIPARDLAALFAGLEELLGRAPCDHSLGKTEAILRARRVDLGAAIPWLAGFGGYCDCEVLANVENVWEQRLGELVD